MEDHEDFADIGELVPDGVLPCDGVGECHRRCGLDADERM